MRLSSFGSRGSTNEEEGEEESKIHDQCCAVPFCVSYGRGGCCMEGEREGGGG